MGARYPYYLLADSKEGRAKEQEVSGKIQPDTPTHGDIRQGFVYERAPHITLKSIANNAEIDVIWENCADDARAAARRAQQGARQDVGRMGNPARGRRQAGPTPPRRLHAAWWEARIARQKKIDDSIAKAADVEYLYDRPYEDNSRVRVAGPVHGREPVAASCRAGRRGGTDRRRSRRDEGKRRRSKLATPPTDFADMVLEHLRPPACSRPRRTTRITLHRRSPAGRASTSAPKASFIEGETRAPRRHPHRPRVRHASPASTLSPPRARPPTRASTC